MDLKVARWASVALFLTAEAGAAVGPVNVVSQLGVESKPSAFSKASAVAPAVAPMIRVSLDAEARAPLSQPVAGRFIRSSLDRGAVVSPLAPLPHRKLRQELDAAPEPNTWFSEARELTHPERSSSPQAVLDDSSPLTGEAVASRPRRHIRVDLSDASVQIATPLPARRLRLRLD